MSLSVNSNSADRRLPFRSDDLRPRKILATLTILFTVTASNAAIMTATDEAHRDLASAYQGKAVWVQTNYTTSTGTTGIGRASGVRLTDNVILTAGHVALSATVTINFMVVGDGLNYVTTPGNTRTIPYSRVLVHPAYQRSNPTATSPDLALIYLDEPLPGPAVNLGEAAAGEVVYCVGYGLWGWSADALNLRDGNARGWEARVQSRLELDISEELYNWTALYDASGLSVAGAAASGDSGGPVFNSTGELVGINIGGSLPTYAQTYYLDLSSNQIRSWILANTPQSNPPLITCVVSGTQAHLAFSSLVSSRVYRVMRSPTATGWEETHQFMATTSAGGWSDPIVPGGRMFYRLEWDE